MNNPFHQYMRLDPPQIVGRDFLMRQLLSGLTESSPISWQIISFRTLGSSTILRYLAHPKGAIAQRTLAGALHPPFDKPDHFVCLYLNCNTYPQDTDFSEWIWDKMQQDKRLAPLKRASEASALNAIKQALVEIEEGNQRVVFLLDHLDMVLLNMDKKRATELRPLVGLAGFVTATEKPLVKINEDVASSWFGSQLFPANIDPLSNEAARKLIDDVLSQQKIDGKARKEYLSLLKETGNYPYYILTGAAHWYDLRKRYPELDQSDLLEIWTNRLLTKGFYGDFFRFWKHISKEEKKSLIDLISSKKEMSPTENDPQALDNLVDVGLVDWDQGRYQPFSRLWEKFIKQKADERVVEEEVEALNGTNEDSDFTQLEAALLDYLKSAPNEIRSYEAILEHVWHDEDTAENRHLLRQIVSRLRQKMSGGGYEGNIFNHRNKGYELRL